MRHHAPKRPQAVASEEDTERVEELLRQVQCARCGGSGYEPKGARFKDGFSPCKACKGSGKKEKE